MSFDLALDEGRSGWKVCLILSEVEGYGTGSRSHPISFTDCDPMTDYQQLEKRFRRLGTLQEASGVLQWDSAVLMPEAGAGARAEQLATMKLVCHEILTDAVLGDLLDGAAAKNDLDAWQRAILREMRRIWLHATAVPGDLVDAASRAASACEQVWRQARPASDFALVLPALQRVLDLTREVAAAKAARLGKNPYEALIDQYEPGTKTDEIDRLFGDLAAFLPGLIAEVLDRQAASPAPPEPQGPFPIERQRACRVLLMKQLGFDFEHGRLDGNLQPLLCV